MSLRVVVWIQSSLRVVDSAGRKARSVTSPVPVATREELAIRLKELLTKSRGGSAKNVLFLTDSPLLLPAVEEVPPAESKLVGKLLSKRVEKAKLINEPFALGIQPILAPGEKPPPRRYLVTIGPLAWLNELDAVVSQTGHRLVAVVPLAVALRPLLKKTGLPPAEPFLLVQELEGALYQIVGRADGTILFYRTLAVGGATALEGLQREVRRTLLFAEQKLNLKIPLILLTEEPAGLETGLEAGEEVKVQTVGQGITAIQAAASLFRFPARSPENVLPREIALREQTRRMRMLLNLGLAGMITFTVAWAATKTIQRHFLVSQSLKEEGMRGQDQYRLERLQDEYREYLRSTDGVRVVMEETQVPVVELILRTLPEALPAGLVMSRCEIRLDEKAAGGKPSQPIYQLKLEGRTRKANEAVLPLVKKLGENLDKNPWNATADVASGAARAGPEVPAELRGPGMFYFYGRTR